MDDLFRWQWMWKSRSRLLALAGAAMALGTLALAYAATRPGPFGKPRYMLIFCGVSFILAGAYQLLQGLFSPAGAFGDHDGSR